MSHKITLRQVHSISESPSQPASVFVMAMALTIYLVSSLPVLLPHLLAFPGFTSQINHLHLNPCLGVSFWESPRLDRSVPQSLWLFVMAAPANSTTWCSTVRPGARHCAQLWLLNRRVTGSGVDFSQVTWWQQGRLIGGVGTEVRETREGAALKRHT